MGYIAEYLEEAEDFFIEFLTEEIEADNVLKLCEVLELQGVYELFCAPSSLDNLILTNSSMESNFTRDEVAYMQCSSGSAIVVKCSETNHIVIFAEIDTQEEDKTLIASAIVKIAIKAFGEEILICLKYDDKLIFGSSCLSDIENRNYIISKWYTLEDLSTIVGIVINCQGDQDELKYAFMQSTLSQYAYRDYDIAKYIYGYVLDLQFISARYDVNLDNEINRYINSRTPDKELIVAEPNNYELREMLKYVGVVESSSYDFLEKAVREEAESSYRADHLSDVSVDFDEYNHVSSIPLDVLNDAEKMVRYFYNDNYVSSEIPTDPGTSIISRYESNITSGIIENSTEDNAEYTDDVEDVHIDDSMVYDQKCAECDTLFDYNARYCGKCGNARYKQSPREINPVLWVVG